jgi:hypothetical protein
MAASRDQLNAWLDTIGDSVLDMQGRHASLSILTIEQFLLDKMAGHERAHAADMARVLDINISQV